MAASEIGIEWVDDYHSWMWPDLANCQEEAERFQSALNGISSFNWGDDLAWDQDFEEQGASTWHPTGTDTTWADAVDIVFYAGHGESSGPKFGDSSHDSGKVKHSELRLGDMDLEWAIFDACYVLQEGGKYYNNCYDMLKGLHYIFGFHTVVGDDAARGEIFADYLNAGETVRSAWIKASQDTRHFRCVDFPAHQICLLDFWRRHQRAGSGRGEASLVFRWRRPGFSGFCDPWAAAVPAGESR